MKKNKRMPENKYIIQFKSLEKKQTRVNLSALMMENENKMGIRQQKDIKSRNTEVKYKK